MAAPSQRQPPLQVPWLECRRQRRARTLSPPSPRTEEHLQACSIRLEVQLQLRRIGNHLCRHLGWSAGGKTRRARTPSPPPPRTEEQPQACSIRWEVQWQLRRKGNHPFAGALVGVPAAETSTHIESAFASHRGASASLLDQMGGGSSTLPIAFLRGPLDLFGLQQGVMGMMRKRYC